MSDNILKNPISAELVEKNSRFIGIGHPCASRQEFEQIHKSLQDKYSDANHICFAYRIIDDGVQHIRFSDDGEPSGTAGKPILNHIQGRDLINTAVFVIRYFGGVKLGAGGLVRAYGGAAKEALNIGDILEFVATSEVRFICSYSDQKQVEYYIKQYDGTVIETQFSDKLEYLISVPQVNAKGFLKSADDLLEILS